MGSVTSKSPLERRNTVLRRSQRRTIANLKPKIEDVFKNIKRLKESEIGPQVQSIKSEIERLKHDLDRKGKNLQPQVIGLHQELVKKLYTADEMLNLKIEENRAKDIEKKKKKAAKKGEEVTEDDEVEVQEVEEHDQPQAEEEANNLENSGQKRQTVELTFVKVIPEEEEPDGEQYNVHNEEVEVRTPEEKRKSILRQGGIAVMPGAMMNEITHQSNRISKQYDESIQIDNQQDLLKTINDIIEDLQDIELFINDFVGAKYGHQYNQLRDILNKHLVTLNLMNPTEEEAVDQLKICKNYVGSCLHFLDEKTMETTKYQPKSVSYEDEVFASNASITSSERPDSNNHTKLQKLMKNTAV